jgi:hypothetical protein
MFKFKPTNKTYSDPISAIFKPGIPFGRQYTKGDICLLHDRIPGSKIFFNSIILREAMLNSKEYLEEVLDIKIIDTRVEKEEAEKPAKEEKPTEPPVEPEPEKVSEPESEPEPEVTSEPETEPETETIPEEEVKEEVVESPAEEDPAIKALADELSEKHKKKKTTKK